MNEITLSKRKFKQCANATIEHDVVTMNYVRAAGLHEIQIANDADPYEFVLELLDRLTASGHLFKLLGCMLIPAELAGKDWTPELCEDTANFIRQLTDDEDKRVINAQITALLSSFFQQGLATLRITPSSSELVDPAE